MELLKAAFKPGNWGGFRILVSCFLQAGGGAATGGAMVGHTAGLSFPPGKINIEVLVLLPIKSSHSPAYLGLGLKPEIKVQNTLIFGAKQEEKQQTRRTQFLLYLTGSQSVLMCE